MRKVTHINCGKCGREVSKNQLSNHLRYCDGNPILKKQRNVVNGGRGQNQYTVGKQVYLSDETRFKMGSARRGKNQSKEMKNKISEGMKLAHKEGRAWNIGMSRWNNEPSYPEKFFMKVIDNEFNDKTYKTEYSIGIYSADFAWVHLKKVIEIDGEQHERFEDYKERDIRKDEFLKQESWEILRLDWKGFYNNPKKYIKTAFEFIHSGEAY